MLFFFSYQKGFEFQGNWNACCFHSKHIEAFSIFCKEFHLNYRLQSQQDNALNILSFVGRSSVKGLFITEK